MKALLKPEHFILQILPSSIHSIKLAENGITINLEQSKVGIVINFLKLSSLMNYNTLLDLWATDKIQPENKRFTLYYMLLSMKRNLRIYLKTNIEIVNTLAKAMSVTKEFASAGFLEREVWDLFGIFFVAHPDLRRLLTDYGFKGFPLRKDFPVTGFKEIKYDDKSARLIYTPIDFVQSYRLYTFENPWTKTTSKSI